MSTFSSRLSASPDTLLNELRSFAPAYYGAVLRELYVETVSCDLLLEAYADITKEIPKFDSKHSTLFAWGFRIVRKHISMKKTEIVLQEIFGCRNPEAYREQRQVTSLTS